MPSLRRGYCANDRGIGRKLNTYNVVDGMGASFQYFGEVQVRSGDA